jgi:hypothetical protein
VSGFLTGSVVFALGCVVTGSVLSCAAADIAKPSIEATATDVDKKREVMR